MDSTPASPRSRILESTTSCTAYDLPSRRVIAPLPLDQVFSSDQRLPYHSRDLSHNSKGSCQKSIRVMRFGLIAVLIAIVAAIAALRWINTKEGATDIAVNKFDGTAQLVIGLFNLTTPMSTAQQYWFKSSLQNLLEDKVVAVDGLFKPILKMRISSSEHLMQ